MADSLTGYFQALNHNRLFEYIIQSVNLHEKAAHAEVVYDHKSKEYQGIVSELEILHHNICTLLNSDDTPPETGCENIDFMICKNRILRSLDKPDFVAAYTFFEFFYNKAFIELADTLINDADNDIQLRLGLSAEKQTKLSRCPELESWYFHQEYLSLGDRTYDDLSVEDVLLSRGLTKEEYEENKKKAFSIKGGFLDAEIEEFNDAKNEVFYSKTAKAVVLLSMIPFLSEEDATKVREITKDSMKCLTEKTRSKLMAKVSKLPGGNNDK